MGFSRQEYWSELPFPSPGDLPNPGVEPGSPAFQTDALSSEPLGKPPETPGVTGKFGLGMQKEAGQRQIEFCQENALVIANTLPTTQEKTLHMDIARWSTWKSD